MLNSTINEFEFQMEYNNTLTELSDKVKNLEAIIATLNENVVEEHRNLFDDIKKEIGADASNLFKSNHLVL